MTTADVPGRHGEWAETRSAAERGAQPPGSPSEAIKGTGGLVAVLVGVAAVAVIAVIAITKNTQTASAIAGITAGIVGSIVGAYFGVKAGSDQTKSAIDSQREQAARAEVYAAHLPAGEASAVIDRAETAARATRKLRSEPRGEP
jgi:hypothetical protein